MPENPFKSFVNQFVADRETASKELETLPSRCEVFAGKEIANVQALRKALLKVESDLQGKTPEQVVEILNRAMATLDGLDMWDSKFSTGNEIPNPARDSIYYTTPSGLSLRFKMSNATGDVSHIIQPFMENIHFVDGTHFPKPMPQIGINPCEYLSDEFYTLQNSDNADSDFESQVKMYYKDGKVYHIAQPEHLYHYHPGNPINKIFFVK